MVDTVYNLKDVSYGYQKSVPVLSNITATIFRGEKLAILGANGCGKSTLLKLLDGLIFPESGEIKAFGSSLTERDLNRNPFEFRRKVGFVFQDSDSQLFCSSVLDEVAFAPLQMGWGQDLLRQTVDATLKDYGLWEQKERPPYRLSGGEKKRVALAAVTVYHPQVLLLDEPTSSLDPRTKRWFWGRLNELNRNGVTIIMATHDLEAGKLADRALVLNERHEVAAMASAAEIFANERLLMEVNLI